MQHLDSCVLCLSKVWHTIVLVRNFLRTVENPPKDLKNLYVEPKPECSLFLNYQGASGQKYGIIPSIKYYGLKIASSSGTDQCK